MNALSRRDFFYRWRSHVGLCAAPSHRGSPNGVAVPLTAQGVGKATPGRRHGAVLGQRHRQCRAATEGEALTSEGGVWAGGLTQRG